MWTVAASGNNVYVGGSFTQAGTVTASHIAKWNGTTWSALSGSFSEGVNNDVYTIALYSPNVYVGGNFTTAAGVTAHYAARWNGISWSAMGTGIGDPVYTMAVNANGTHVYAGGLFKWIGNLQVNQIAMWNTSTGSWSALGTGLDGDQFYPRAYSIVVSSSETVYVGGDFTRAGGTPANSLAVWNGNSWSSTSGGVSDPWGYERYVYGMAIRDADFDTLYLGGNFTQVGGIGGEPSYHFARRYFVPVIP